MSVPAASGGASLDKGRPKLGDRIMVLPQHLGQTVVGIAQETGGILLLLFRILRRLFPPRLDYDETWRNLYKMGVRSVPIVMLTAFFTGLLMVIQSAAYVKQYSAREMLGWGVGMSVFREIGPILIALMFSGRVGSNNTAELATMTVTEQIDALRALAIEPIRFLIVPRFLSMVIMLTLLTVIGDLLAILGGGIFSETLMDVDFNTFANSLLSYVKLSDFTHGIAKATIFGVVIGVVSCHFGLNVKGGARGVGRAVNACVVSSAVGIFVLDYFVTGLLGG